jgi:K+-sensing histidine kinase KdpD
MRQEKSRSAQVYYMQRKYSEFWRSYSRYEKYETFALCGCAVLASLVSLYVLRASQPILHGRYPYLPLWPAVILSIRYWGTIPSLLATVVGLIGVEYWFLAPYNSLAVENPADVVGMAGFLFGAGFLIVSSRSEEKLRRQLRDTIRTARSALRALLTAYVDTACGCKNEPRKTSFGHQTSCLAHPSTPVIMGAERSIRQLSLAEEDATDVSRRISL